MLSRVPSLLPRDPNPLNTASHIIIKNTLRRTREKLDTYCVPPPPLRGRLSESWTPTWCLSYLKLSSWAPYLPVHILGAAPAYSNEQGSSICNHTVTHFYKKLSIYGNSYCWGWEIQGSSMDPYKISWGVAHCYWGIESSGVLEAGNLQELCIDGSKMLCMNNIVVGEPIKGANSS